MTFRTVRIALLVLTATAASAHAQAPPPMPRLALSVTPTVVVSNWHKALEAEARVTHRMTAGLGAGTVMGMPSGPDVTASTPEERMIHVDGFARWFFAGRAFDGWSIGARTGMTRLPGDRLRPHVGADIHRHWNIGGHLVGNVGWGMASVVGGPGSPFLQRYVPWVKAHVGVAF